MSECRILYFGEAIVEDAADVASVDLVSAAKTASSIHPDLAPSEIIASIRQAPDG
jgi:hypothetical protein